MNLLIPGGAGYIGSHMARYAQDHGHEVVVLDDFSTGNEWAVKDCEILEINLLDNEELDRTLKGRKFDGVIHFAAKSLVGESVINPNLYYRNNVIGTLNLLNVLLKNDINNFVFSSSAAIFGNPVQKKINEDHSKKPINPYGSSKLMVEEILQDLSTAYDLNVICFRYFNAAGAHESGEIGESHDPETHLIPNILKVNGSDKRKLRVFGNDYDTHDGTCIRDYVHVTDLAQAHLLGLDYMKRKNGFSALNLGNGNGFSVLDIINSCERVMKTTIDYDLAPRRNGDPASLVAECSQAKSQIGWQPIFKNIDDIVTTAWRWHRSRAQ